MFYSQTLSLLIAVCAPVGERAPLCVSHYLNCIEKKIEAAVVRDQRLRPEEAEQAFAEIHLKQCLMEAPFAALAGDGGEKPESDGGKL